MKKHTLLFSLLLFLPLQFTAQTISGKITDQKGDPIPDALIEVYVYPSIYFTSTNQDGTFGVELFTRVEKDELPASFLVSCNYPNPFNPKTRFNISVPKPSQLKVEVFNILGQRVKNVIEKELVAGNSFVDIELNGLASGVYIARFIIDNEHAVARKLMLIHGSKHLIDSSPNNNITQPKEMLLKTTADTKVDSIVVSGEELPRTVYSAEQLPPEDTQLGSLTMDISKPCPGLSTITHGGMTYNTTQIGTQCWLRENINSGTMIAGRNNQIDNGILEKYCYNDNSDKCKNGSLYQWSEAMRYATNEYAQGICPDGWHIPTTGEWLELRTFVTDTGGDELLHSKNGGSNSTGFSAFLVGYRQTEGTFGFENVGSHFWSSTSNWKSFSMATGNNVLAINNGDPTLGLSVRCIKNLEQIIQSPSLNNPSNGADNVLMPPTLKWNPVFGALSYTIQVSTSSLFENLIYNQSGLTKTNLQITGLNFSTKYYWKVNASNTSKTSEWSEVASFTTGGFNCGVQQINYAGKTYNTVKIGNQCWLKENLDVGTMIFWSEEPSDNGTIEKYCYKDNINYCSSHGGLYQWNEAMQYLTIPGSKGICPDGWHIPTLSEYQTLAKVVNYNGNTLKAVGQGYGVGSGTNDSGFSALLAGWRPYNSTNSWYWDVFNIHANLWTSTENNLNNINANHTNLSDSWNGIQFYSHDKKTVAFSIRCILDASNLPRVPKLNSPQNEASNQPLSVVLNWDAIDEATSYTLIVAENRDFINSKIYSALGSNSKEFSDLKASTTYYWKVSAINNKGTVESEVWNFKTIRANVSCTEVPSVYYLGKTYNTVMIGNQCWLKENLDAGTMIPWSQEPSNNGTIEKYCYKNNPSYCSSHGGLYQWNEAMQYFTIPGSKGICPDGWHIPSFSDFQILGRSVGENGNTLKAVGQGLGNGAGTNSSGFSALLAGWRPDNNPNYWDIFDFYGNLWSSSESDNNKLIAKHVLFFKDQSRIDYGERDFKTVAFSIRCIKDESSINRTPNVPTNYLPTNGTGNHPISLTFQWNVSDGASSYTLQISLNNSFSSYAYNQNNITSTSQQVTGLYSGITYYWRVSATNSFGTSSYSETWSFTTGFNCGDQILYSGKTYNTVQIGTRCWLKENLDVGTMVKGDDNSSDNGAIEKYCYDDNQTNCDTYGGLYQWDEAMQYSTGSVIKGICPDGWHIPSKAEFETLAASVGNNGNNLKAVSQGGTNTSGFSAMIAGGRARNGSFAHITIDAHFWTTSSSGSDRAYEMNLIDTSSNINYLTQFKDWGLSIRCIKD